MIHSPTKAQPIHRLLSHLVATEPPLERPLPLPWMGTMQTLNSRLKRYPLIDFANYALRGVGQVIFVNNPVSGALILLALFIQSPWVGLFGLQGAVTSTLTALALNLDKSAVRNGLFGYNGLLVGAALATFGDLTAGAGGWGWGVATVLFAALTTVLMKTFGIWWAKTLKTPLLTLPFNIATLICLILVPVLPGLERAESAALSTSLPDWVALGLALPTGFGQVFLADDLVSGLLILLAVALCTPLGAAVGLLGAFVGLLSGAVLGVPLASLSTGLWSYNTLLCAMAIGGVFYAPINRSLFAGALTALLSIPIGVLLGLVLSPLGLPVLTLPFCLATIACISMLTQSLPSLVPVALHSVASPEEHWRRYRAAKAVIANFRQQLNHALAQHSCNYLLERASAVTKGDLRYLFNLIDTDQDQLLSLQELSETLHRSGKGASKAELNYLFSCIDRDRSGALDFEEFGELILRHRRLMVNYESFKTYFIPIDANGDEAISFSEMTTALASVDRLPLSDAESAYLIKRFQESSLTWNRFIEMLLLT